MNNPSENSLITDMISIELWSNGAVKVQGSINNKQRALDIIEAARDAVLSYHKHNTPIVIPNGYEKV